MNKGGTECSAGCFQSSHAKHHSVFIANHDDGGFAPQGSAPSRAGHNRGHIAPWHGLAAGALSPGPQVPGSHLLVLPCMKKFRNLSWRPSVVKNFFLSNTGPPERGWEGGRGGVGVSRPLDNGISGERYVFTACSSTHKLRQQQLSMHSPAGGLSHGKEVCSSLPPPPPTPRRSPLMCLADDLMALMIKTTATPETTLHA